MTNFLNTTLVDELKIIMEEDLALLYETYISDSQAKLAELQSAFDDNDFDLIRRIAHSLKGSSRNVGADVVAEICERLEFSAREENIPNGSDFLADIQSAFESTQTQIDNEIL